MNLHQFRGRLTFLNRFILFISVIGTMPSYAQPLKLYYIGENPLSGGKPARDTIPAINMFRKFEWEVRVIKGKAPEQRFYTRRPDTLGFDKPDTVYYATTFRADSGLINKLIELHYTITGSCRIKSNGAPILETGVFATDNAGKLSGTSALSEYLNVYITDTLEHFEVMGTPDKKSGAFELKLALLQVSVAEDSKQSILSDIEEAFALGFYYMAFGVIFLIFFLFFKDRREHLYFSLFCFFAGLAFLWNNLNLNILAKGQSMFWTILSFEFLSIFFARVLRNKEKSKIPLVIIVCAFAISFIPILRVNKVMVNAHEVPVIPLVMQVILISYAFISSLYFLFSGFGQKRWEARAIVYIFSGALALSFIVPYFVFIVTAINDPRSAASSATYLEYFTNVGLCLFPLSAAIVLGRRNGLNQKQLIQQIQSIEKLSEENLAKEKEKKQLLENQNMELEMKVNERTVEVLQQKDIIEIKNKALTDNLTYAQRIQSAILPDIKLIYRTLEQSFILYLPKDIVSGDFYAFSERAGRVLIMAGDCTGHGVSGAFMSMIGGSLLNQIINERGIERPDLILNQLNSSVIDTFRQDENESNDGMDISVCSFDLTQKELQYAGANRPLWLIRNGELQVIRPDKHPIGGLQSAIDRTFTNHHIELQKGDTIYIFTDGYADQFGGENGKKMMTSKFKEVLLSIQGMSMQEQEQYLKNHFDQWKGSSEQVDDVLVIGVRV